MLNMKGTGPPEHGGVQASKRTCMPIQVWERDCTVWFADFASQSRPFVRAMAPRMAEHKTVDSVTRSKRQRVFCGILCQVQHQSLIEWLLSKYFTIVRSHANGSDGIGWNSVEIPFAFTDLSMMSDSAVGKWRQDTGQQGTSRRGLGILCDTLALASTLKKP